MGKRIAGLAAGVAVLTALSGAGTATAAPASAGGTGAKGGDHCVLSVESGEVTCFETAKEADRAAPDWVFKFWGKPNFKGKSFRVESTIGRCPERVVHPSGYNNLRRTEVVEGHFENWNNRISSLKSRKNCRVKLYAKKNWKGHRTGWLKKEDRLGTVPDPGANWNNAATSLAFKGI